MNVERPYAIGENILGRNVEAGPLEDEWREPERKSSRGRGRRRRRRPPEYCELTFEQGLPVAIDGSPSPSSRR